MADSLEPRDLAACDVLLYRGTSRLAAAIRFCDGTEVSHASLHLGRGEVAEALGPGLVRRTLAASLAGQQWILARRLKALPPSVAPVRNHALELLGGEHRYAYEQLVLLAFLCLARRLPLAPGLRLFIRCVLDAAAAVLEDFVAAGTEPMICSEFVYRCYDEAGAGFEIAIDRGAPLRGRLAATAPGGAGVHPDSVLGRMAAAPRAASSLRRRAAARPTRSAPPPSATELDRRFAVYLAQVRAGRRGIAASLDDPRLRNAVGRFAAGLAATAPLPHRAATARKTSPLEALFATAADFVTPGDLWRSESLATLGVLPGGPAATRRAAASRSTPQRTAAASHTTRRTWTRPQVETAIARLVARLTPGVDKRSVTPKTRFATDLGWDEWALLRLVRPVRDIFDVRLVAATVKRLKTVDELLNLVLSQMESVS